MLASLEGKQKAAEERVAEKERQMEQQWKIYNEEEMSKKEERDKRIQRHVRKLELKKEKVVGKLFRHEAQVSQRKT